MARECICTVEVHADTADTVGQIGKISGRLAKIGSRESWSVT